MTRPAYLVSHTHWDREWYRTFQQFRLDLVRTVDLVLDTLEGDPSFVHFLLDGQTIVLDDYLAMRPERVEELRRLIAAGRLGIGPWYCHPDLFLVSGESLVRNLLLGLTMARAYGQALLVGYIPDQFGHTGQMPQIFQGFGITSAVLWRGVDARASRNETWWEAPDGSRVFLAVLPQGYGYAQGLPLDPAALAERLRQLCDLLAPGATGPGVLLMNGNDHLPPQPGLPAALTAANRLLDGAWHVRQTSLDEAVTRLHAEGRPEGVLRGELRSPATAHLLPGVLSARIPLKRRNALAQLLLEREAEPYATWAAILGARYPHGELREAWRLLLQNHPHDSICGCSIDQVHREMGVRFDGVEQIGAELVARALGHVAACLDTRPPGELGTDASPHTSHTSHTVPLVVFNGGDGPRTERVALAVQLPGVAAGYDLLDAEGRPVPHHWTGEAGEPSMVMEIPRENIPSPAVVLSQIEGNRVMGIGLQDVALHTDADGLHVEITVGESGIMSREEIEAEIWRVDAALREADPLPATLHVHRNARHDLQFLARAVPAYGYTTLWLRPTDTTTLSASEAGAAEAPAPAPAPQAPDDPYEIATDLFVVRADPATAALTLTDRRTGTTYGPCNVFVDGGDAGDSYTYAPPAGDIVVDRPTAPPTIEATRDPMGARLRITQELVVPEGLAEDRASRATTTTELRITSVVTLTEGCPRVDIATTVDNTARDHRLRVTFGVPVATDHVHAEAAFDVVRRPLGVAVMEGTAMETPVADAPQQGFVVVHAGERGLMVANVGLPEYEAYSSGAQTTLALTLLRCIGWLSRDDLPTRRGPAGPSLPVPEAQCPGTHTFTYSLIPLAADWRAAVPQAHHARLPLRALTAPITDGGAPARGSFLQVDAPGVVVSTIKGAEDGRGLVVRLYNIDGTTAHGTLRLARPVALVERLSLDERPLETLHSYDIGNPLEEIPLELGPHRIETLRLVLAEEEDGV